MQRLSTLGEASSTTAPGGGGGGVGSLFSKVTALVLEPETYPNPRFLTLPSAPDPTPSLYI